MSLLMFFIIVIFAAVNGIIVFRQIRGICFLGPNATDNEKMLKVASRIRLNKWPSSMHAFSGGRCQLREFWVIGLHVIGKFFKNPESEEVNVALSLFSHAVSGILSFIILLIIFGEWPAFFCALLYLGSVWGYQVSLYLGHVIYSQMWFLLALLPIITMSLVAPASFIISCFVSGALTVVCFSASSASRKFPPIIFLIFMVVLSPFLTWPLDIGTWIRAIGGMILAFLLLNILVVQVCKLVLMEYNKLFMNNWAPERFTSHLQDMVKLVRLCSICLIMFLGFSALFVTDESWYIAVSLFFTGVISAAIYVLGPHLLNNTVRYLNYLKIGSWASHFHAYPDHLKTFGRKLPRSFRGEGAIWVPKFLFRIVPIPFALYCSMVIYVGIWEFDIDSWAEIMYMFFLSILPTLIVEISKGLQVGKSYFPSFCGMLIFIAYGIEFILSDLVAGKDTFLTVMFVILSLNYILNIWTYATDVLPCRMAPTILRNYLMDQGISHFYTYDTPYNDSFVKAMAYQYPEFTVDYVKKMEDAGSNGIFVVPPTSSKSVSMETQQFAIINGDFRKDSMLNKLIDSDRLEKISIYKIKTLGSSRIYVHESEVTSFRDLGLRQITERDRWLGHGWVLNLNSINVFQN